MSERAERPRPKTQTATVALAPRREWLLQRLETQALRGPDGEDVEFLEDAKRWPHRLAARMELETRWGELQLEYRLVPSDGVPRRPPRPSLDDWRDRLLYPDPLAAAEALQRRFVETCDLVEGWLTRVVGVEPGPRPGLALTCAGHTWAGLYRPPEHEVVLVAPYAMLHPDYLRTVVAHEVVHAYQDAFTGGVPSDARHGGHGGDFYALMRHAAQTPVERHTHDYSPVEAARLGEATSLWWREARERGLVASAPCRVHWDLDAVQPRGGDLQAGPPPGYVHARRGQCSWWLAIPENSTSPQEE
jgi:hypothetical protein